MYLRIEQLLDSLSNTLSVISPYVQPENINLQFGVIGPTGALLGGGSKEIHSIIEAIINSVEEYRGLIK
ncbi:hypothetical protein A2Y85_07155 [candidate division WOR-3 bacterium RBG_13_43_14]|uniref:Uncharacterized protein n=1 Tax=candidate division WOR-3 bacterium RBG_13_43_14 TaxID=1802590 RepID=A0A1F4UA29_UNCW3|nr:MAG: hypothetical protein A2Y85_07155 [candidate division WOR-3 bacterium RBG_13_43_14]